MSINVRGVVEVVNEIWRKQGDTFLSTVDQEGLATRWSCMSMSGSADADIELTTLSCILSCDGGACALKVSIRRFGQRVTIDIVDMDS